MTHGGDAVRYRVLRDLWPEPIDSPELRLVPYASRTGWMLVGMQESDGSWPGGLLATPVSHPWQGVGTIPAYRRLLELGWDPECPAMHATKRLLFRLLAEDQDPSVMAEMRPATDDEEQIRRGRLMLREAAAAALAQAGYEADPRLRGAARRLIDRVGAFLKSPLAEKPWIRLGNQHVLAADVAAPSFSLLVMLSHMPQFRSEHSEFMERLFGWLTQPWPRQAAVQQVGDQLLDQPHLVLGDFLATRNDLDEDMPSALGWLELMARLGWLTRHEGWVRLFERTLDDRSRKGLWTPPRSMAMPAQVPEWSWPVLPLHDGAWGEDAATGLSADVTFRLGLIARIAGRTIEWV